MTHPYENLPTSRFWRTAVGERSPFQIEGLWSPKFRIKPRSKLVTAGSCFAQHISQALVARGYTWIDAEPGPENMSAKAKQDFHYGTFSFRTGNIYTVSMLAQWISWATGNTSPPDDLWEKDGRFYDPFRPAVEPGGFASKAEALKSRGITIAAVREAIETGDVFIFTLGLTEAWQNKENGIEYAACPGTVAGKFDLEKHVFVNHDYPSNSKLLRNVIRMIYKINPRMQILLTVSPVPLTATASEEHVLNATSYSKSVLRAVAGDMVNRFKQVDYFPSYEIITHPTFRGMFYAPNQRSVDPNGVEFVMNHFFTDQERAFSKKYTIRGPFGVEKQVTVGADEEEPEYWGKDATPFVAEDVRCEEEMLDAFSKS